MTHDSSLPAALCRANQELGQRIGNAVLENQRRWFDLGVRQLDAAFMSSPKSLHADGSPVFGDSPFWRSGWMWEGAMESLLAIQNAFATDVQEALAQWQQSCATLLPATAAKDADPPPRHRAGELA